jgi:hypothetical protein
VKKSKTKREKKKLADSLLKNKEEKKKFVLKKRLMYEDVCKLQQYRGVVDDLVEHEMRRLRAFAELVSQNTLYRRKDLAYTPKLGSLRAPALIDEFLSRCATEGYDVTQSATSYGRCVLRVHVVGSDERKRDQRDAGENGAQKPNAGVEGSRCEPRGGAKVLDGPPARSQIAKVQ